MSSIWVAPCTGAWIETRTPGRRGAGGESPPARGRGSKRRVWDRQCQCSRRPLHGGVDRNLVLAQRIGAAHVAPCTGAWIETSPARWTGPTSASPPARGRGSKHKLRYVRAEHIGRPLHGGVDRNTRWATAIFPGHVAPCTGAWIETSAHMPSAMEAWSPPARGRGSKPVDNSGEVSSDLSPPARGRGSKLKAATASPLLTGRPLHGGVDRNLTLAPNTTILCVAPCTGAWIETALRA